MATKRRTDEQWRKLLDEQGTSGQTNRAFCTAHGLCLSQFYKKRRQLTGSAFVPVQVSRAAPSATRTLVAVEAEGVSIFCDTGTPTAWIADLIKTLRA